MIEALTGSSMFDQRGNHSLFVKARMRPGVGVPQVDAAVAAVATTLAERRVEDWDPEARFVVVPLSEVVLYPPMDRYIRASAWLLTAVVALVLLLACTNLASFLLARALDRRRDIAVRIALGASRGSLVRRLLVETTLLSLLAAAVGTGLAVWLLRLLLTADLPLPLPVSLDLGLDWNVLAFTAGVSIVAGCLLGILPALHSTQPDLIASLKSDTAGGGSSAGVKWRSALVIAQLTVSLVLLVGAGLFLRSLQAVQSVDPGFGRRPTALMTFMVPATRYTADEGRVYTGRLLDRFRQLPGIDALGLTGHLPLNTLSTQTIDFNIDGHTPPGERGAFIADRAEVDTGFFDAMGIRIVRGRNFNDADLPESRRVAIVSDAMARRFWAGGDAIGRLIRTRDEKDADLLVVGVASDVKVRTLGEAPRNMVYRPYSQEFARFLTVVARASTDADRLAVALLTAGREVDPELWVWEAKTMAEHLAIMRLPAQLSAFLLSAFALLALVLAAVGLYGVVSYAVARRAREVGIRLALGADPGAVVRLMALGGLRLVAVGCIAGLVAAFAISRLLSSLLFGIDAVDAFTFAAVPVLLAAVGGLAAYLPARRASRIDPIAALRAE
jgi:predicted permease